MGPKDFAVLTRRRPFVPFRIIASDGTVYRVEHPDLILVGMTSVTIGYPSQADPHFYDRTDIVALRHVVRLEPGVESPEASAP